MKRRLRKAILTTLIIFSVAYLVTILNDKITTLEQKVSALETTIVYSNEELYYSDLKLKFGQVLDEMEAYKGEVKEIEITVRQWDGLLKRLLHGEGSGL